MRRDMAQALEDREREVRRVHLEREALADRARRARPGARACRRRRRRRRRCGRAGRRAVPGSRDFASVHQRVDVVDVVGELLDVEALAVDLPRPRRSSA